MLAARARAMSDRCSHGPTMRRFARHAWLGSASGSLLHVQGQLEANDLASSVGGGRAGSAVRQWRTSVLGGIAIDARRVRLAGLANEQLEAVQASKAQ
mmetsp:Transcript_7872/g.25067  ORF Transcript_7872/g.25067 Transcript_7872/m.25067 type:complete len:98 (-) Transcript_7872:509-802(-)